MSFKHRLNRKVTLKESGESGIIVGRAHYNYCDNNYLIRYKCADGRQVEGWWTESAIAEPEKKAKPKK